MINTPSDFIVEGSINVICLFIGILLGRYGIPSRRGDVLVETSTSPSGNTQKPNRAMYAFGLVVALLALMTVGQSVALNNEIQNDAQQQAQCNRTMVEMIDDRAQVRLQKDQALLSIILAVRDQLHATGEDGQKDIVSPALDEFVSVNAKLTEDLKNAPLPDPNCGGQEPK